MEYKRLTKWYGKEYGLKEENRSKEREDVWFGGYEDEVRALKEEKTLLSQRLGELETKIEQGKMIELPCKVGDWIWVVCGTISEYQISEFWYDGVFFMFKCTNAEYVQEHRGFSFFNERIGKTVFLTREEAEKRLRELQGDKE